MKRVFLILLISLLAITGTAVNTWAQQTVPLQPGVPVEGRCNETSSEPGRYVYLCATQYILDVPEGMISLEAVLFQKDFKFVCLYVRFNKSINFRERRGYDWRSCFLGGEQVIVIPNPDPGRYYFGVANGEATPQTFTLTVRLFQPGAPPPPPLRIVPLNSGVHYSGVAPGGGVLHITQYKVEVPEGARSLEIQVTITNTEKPADLDLFVRLGQPVEVVNKQVIADWRATGPEANEVLIITPDSSPPLQPGTYYVAIANFSEEAQSYTVRALVLTANLERLIPGVSVQGTTAEEAGLHSIQYVIEVPSWAKVLTIQLVGQAGELNLHVRFGQPVELVDGQIQADFSAAAPGASETLVLRGVKPGLYYIAIENVAGGVQNFMLTATLSS